MADQLCTPADLASFLQQDLDASTATLLVECATAVVQEAAGSRILEVTDEPVALLGDTQSWLDLPQRPVTSVTSVQIDGAAVTEGTTTGTWRRFGARLWRDVGWATCLHEPSTVEVTYTHGYPTGDQGLQLARSAVLSLAALPYENPGGAVRVAIDDYSAAYEAMSARLESSPPLRAALRRQYGRRSGLVRIG